MQEIFKRTVKLHLLGIWQYLRKVFKILEKTGALALPVSFPCIIPIFVLIKISHVNDFLKVTVCVGGLPPPPLPNEWVSHFLSQRASAQYFFYWTPYLWISKVYCYGAEWISYIWAKVLEDNKIYQRNKFLRTEIIGIYFLINYIRLFSLPFP